MLLLCCGIGYTYVGPAALPDQPQSVDYYYFFKGALALPLNYKHLFVIKVSATRITALTKGLVKSYLIYSECVMSTASLCMIIMIS